MDATFRCEISLIPNRYDIGILSVLTIKSPKTGRMIEIGMLEASELCSTHVVDQFLASLTTASFTTAELKSLLLASVATTHRRQREKRCDVRGQPKKMRRGF